MRLLLPTFALTLWAACPGPPAPISLAAPEGAPKARDYEKELRRWTRQTSVMQAFDTTLRAHATLRSPRFEAAYLARRATLFKLPTEEIAKSKEQAQKRWQDSLEFVLVVATHDADWNDLDRKRSHWRVFLSNDQGQQVRPREIRLQRRITATDRVFFPHIGMFYQLYHVEFPQRLTDGSPLVGPKTAKLRLQILGALGNAQLEWELKR